MFGRAQETTTGTTGNLTLAGAATGYATFNTIFSNNTDATGLPFQYFIRHRNGTQWETGIGYLSAATTLVRDLVIRNSSGTSSALTFSAGTKDVIAALCPHGAVMTLPTVYTSATSRLLNSGYQPFSAGTGTLTADLQYYVPFRLDCADTVDAVWAMTTAGTTGNMIASIYTMLPSTGAPAERVTISGALALSATGALLMTFSAVTLPPGWYYLGVNMDTNAASSTFYKMSGSSDTVIGVLGKGSSNNSIVGFTESHVYDGSTTPTTVGSLTNITTGNCPILGVRIA